MYINTKSQELMESSVLKYLNVGSQELADFFLWADKKATMENKSLDGDILNQVIDDFISLHSPENKIDQILFFHLSRRLDDGKSLRYGKNLFELLTTENVLSKFLKENEVMFIPNKKRLELYYKGSLISLEDREAKYVPYLRRRLGYSEGNEDYCFNGFAAKDGLYHTNYARDLYHNPEFIGRLALFLKCKDIIPEYFKNSQYYCIEYCVPIDKVLFDVDDKMTKTQKERYLLKNVIQRLYEYCIQNSRRGADHEKLILRLGEFDTMSEEYFMTSEIITSDMLK